MNKKEFAEAIAAKTGATKKDAEAHVNAALDVLQETLAKKELVSFIGFGSFETKKRAERIARNPRNPEETVKVPATNAVAFKAGKLLKEAVNK